MNIRWYFTQLFSLFIFFIILGHYTTSHAQHVAAGRSAFVCGTDKCDPKRRAYVGKSKRWACSISRALKRAIGRLEALKRALQREKDAKARCIRNNPRRPRVCNWRNRNIRIYERAIQKQQAKLDKIFNRVKFQCDSSLPHPHIPDPNNCEQMEAAKYCPVNSPQDAYDKTKKRCDDMTAEEFDAEITCGNIVCLKPAHIAHVESKFPSLSSLAANIPTCETPTPTPTATATDTPTTPAATATATTIPTSTATAVATATPTITPTVSSSGLTCSNPSPPTGNSAERCVSVPVSGGGSRLLCCIEVAV
jgi:ferredoxin-like protein FixX